jgi:putative two-component system response regulator
LLVDDDINATAALQMAFELEGYSVATAANGEFAWNALRVHRPDLIVTDLNMPIMDGIEFCLKLERNAALADIPVVLTSSSRCPPRFRHANAYLHKPFSVERLFAIVRHLLQAHVKEGSTS